MNIKKPLGIFSYYKLLWQNRRLPYVDYYLGNSKTLDIGCGEGKMLAMYSNWQGIDVNDSLIEQCRNMGLAAQKMSAFALDFSDETFEGVHAAQLIEHFAPLDAIKFLQEASRVLKPKGILLISTPGEKGVWGTFSHIRPYPPLSFKKLLSISTEGYISSKKLPLEFVAAHATQSSILDPIWSRKDPDGWVIVLQKT